MSLEFLPEHMRQNLENAPAGMNQTETLVWIAEKRKAAERHQPAMVKTDDGLVDKPSLEE